MRLDRAGRRDFQNEQRAFELRKNLEKDKECQVVIRNYRKDGSPFDNLLTIIPITEEGEVEASYHVGFQIDLHEQPKVIFEHMRSGNYLTPKEPPKRPTQAIAKRGPMPVLVAKEMKRLLDNPNFLRTIRGKAEDNHPLHYLMLETGPDFLHVVSLKASFLYMAPSIQKSLGWNNMNLAGRSVVDIAHPEDIVPLMRELKESSSRKGPPKTVNLRYRARTKNGPYVWVEARGRLHLEPGKGKKAVILTGRAKEMTNLPWEVVMLGGGLATMKEGAMRQEFWGTLSRRTLLLTNIGGGIKDVLGWKPEEWRAKKIKALVVGDEDIDRKINSASTPCVTIHTQMRKKDGTTVAVVLNVFTPLRNPAVRVGPAPLIYQVRLADAEIIPINLSTSSSPNIITRHGNAFAPLDAERNSSWQYELQQLRISNQNLKQEVIKLENAFKAVEKKRQAAAAVAAAQAPPQYGGVHLSVMPPASSNQDRRYEVYGLAAQASLYQPGPAYTPSPTFSVSPPSYPSPPSSNFYQQQQYIHEYNDFSVSTMTTSTSPTGGSGSASPEQASPTPSFNSVYHHHQSLTGPTFDFAPSPSAYPLQMQQLQHQGGGPEFGGGQSIAMAPLPGLNLGLGVGSGMAALPMRASVKGNRSTAAPKETIAARRLLRPLPRLGGRSFAGGSYGGTSPYVQRVQDDVSAMMMAQAAAGAYNQYGSPYLGASESVTGKRTWAEMRGGRCMCDLKGMGRCGC